MGQKFGPVKEPAEQVVREIRRATRRQFSAEEKIRIVLTGLRGEDSTAELCRREGIVQNLYYRWSKEFLEAGRKRLAGDTARGATSDEVKDLRREASALWFLYPAVSIPRDLFLFCLRSAVARRGQPR
jgi:transposase